MKNIYKISGTVVFLALLLVSYTHCDIGTKLNSSPYGAGVVYPDDASHSLTDSSGDTEEEQLVQESVDVGLKNFEQISVSMSNLTGIPVTNNNISKLFATIKTQLPVENEIKAFAAANQVAIMKLASEYCNELVKNTTLRSQKWPGLNFSQKASTAFSSTGTDRFIDESLSSFMPHLTDGEELYNYYGSELLSVVTDLLSSSTDNATTTRNIAFGACTILLSSFEMNTL